MFFKACLGTRQTCSNLVSRTQTRTHAAASAVAVLSFRVMALAVSVSDLEVCNLAYGGNLEELRGRLEEDPDLIRRRDSNERTALHWACSSGQKEVVSYLLEAGAEVKALHTYYEVQCTCNTRCTCDTSMIRGLGTSLAVLPVYTSTH